MLDLSIILIPIAVTMIDPILLALAAGAAWWARSWRSCAIRAGLAALATVPLSIYLAQVSYSVLTVGMVMRPMIALACDAALIFWAVRAWRKRRVA